MGGKYIRLSAGLFDKFERLKPYGTPSCGYCQHYVEGVGCVLNGNCDDNGDCGTCCGPCVDCWCANSSPCCQGCGNCFTCASCACQCAAVIDHIEIIPYEHEEGYSVGCQWHFEVAPHPSDCSCVTWSAPGADPASQNGGCVFWTRWNSPGEKTVTATTPCNSKQRQVTVAAPTNFHQTYWEERPDGVLYFEYRWESTSGDLNDLNPLSVGEKVDYPGGGPYYYWPSPPWIGMTDDPFIRDRTAITGFGTDTHSHAPFIPPYQVASFTATQVYRWLDCCGNYTPLLGPHSIYRQVTGAPCITGSGFRYIIEKTGCSASTCLP